MVSEHTPPMAARPDRPLGDQLAVAVAHAVADHMSARFGDVNPDAGGARALRAAFALDALDKAARCPLCRRELEAVLRG